MAIPSMQWILYADLSVEQLVVNAIGAIGRSERHEHQDGGNPDGDRQRGAEHFLAVKQPVIQQAGHQRPEAEAAQIKEEQEQGGHLATYLVWKNALQRGCRG